MNYLKLYCIFLFSTMLISCTNKHSNFDAGVPVYTVDYLELKKEPLNDLKTEKESIQYILLKDSCDKNLFGRPDKIKINKKRIYVADQRMRILAVYNVNGEPVATVGQRGQGPGEYVNMTDFDVDSIGNVCVLDGRLDKILFYDSDYRFVYEKTLPFEADIVKFVGGGNMLYGLSSWNLGENKGDKIVLTDRDVNIVTSFFRYDKYVDPSYWISSYQFAESKDYIAYNQTINDDIYVFTHSGVLKEIIHFDFGDKTVPDENKVEIESNLRDFDNFYLLKKIYAVTDDYIVGTLWESQKTKMFIVDRISKTCYLSDEIAAMDLNFICGYSENGFISNLIEPNPMYPDSVNSHLQSEKAVLKIQSIN